MFFFVFWFLAPNLNTELVLAETCILGNAGEEGDCIGAVGDYGEAVPLGVGAVYYLGNSGELCYLGGPYFVHYEAGGLGVAGERAAGRILDEFRIY